MRAGDEAQIGGLEALIFGLLLFVVGGLVLSDAWGVLDAKLAAAGAAREAARSVVQAAPGSNVETVATRAASVALEQEGRDPSRMTVAVEGTLVRCQPIIAEVRYRVPLIKLPLVGGLGSSFVVTGYQEMIVDPYRSGLEGAANCASK